MDWQDPLVDIFNFVILGTEWTISKKKGDV